MHTPTIRRSGDPKTAFQKLSAEEVLFDFGFPTFLLSTSKKTDTCLSVNVLARILYMTPGILCSDATTGCLNSCLGHSSGYMAMPTHAAARDRRTALYLDNRPRFMSRLEDELYGHRWEAKRRRLQPAARLNGSSDLAWERLHPGLFREFPDVQFYDYTKNVPRMRRFLAGDKWPENYHLTFSAAPGNHDKAREILGASGTVAVVFSPDLPETFWDFPVIDGDNNHDARFFDDSGSVVGLRAKGRAKGDVTGFTVRPCQVPSCQLSRSKRHSRPRRGVQKCTGTAA